jgi:hypothetical protein
MLILHETTLTLDKRATCLYNCLTKVIENEKVCNDWVGDCEPVRPPLSVWIRRLLLWNDVLWGRLLLYGARQLLARV